MTLTKLKTYPGYKLSRFRRDQYSVSDYVFKRMNPEEQFQYLHGWYKIHDPRGTTPRKAAKVEAIAVSMQQKYDVTNRF